MTTALPTTGAGPLASGYWKDLTSPELAAVDPEHTVALLPVSAVEQHGAHLPLGTDALINQGITDQVLREPPQRARLLVLPALDIGDSIEHGDYAGSLSARLETVVNLWLDVGASVARAGVRKLIIFNSHGGQRGHVDQVAVRLRTHHKMMVARANIGGFGKPPGLFSDEERAHGLHGGAIETSLMLYLRPDLVRMDKAINAPSSARQMAGNQFLGMERGIGIGWMAQDLHASGICGDATNASADVGEQLLLHLANGLRTLCDELAATPLSVLQQGPLT